jgi:hypothetical protein
MDKVEYVERSPLYYSLAIAVALRGAPGPIPEFKIRSRYPHEDDSGSPEAGSLLDRAVVWQRAVAWLVDQGLITIRYDTFGPPIFFKDANFDEKFDQLTKDESSPFHAYDLAGGSEDWLIPALYAVDNAYDNLDMRVDDFEKPDAEWVPIQIERGDPNVEGAISALERVIEEVRADNGYSATYPQERDYVLEGLQGTLGKFESLSISAAYVRMGIERLQILTRRFGGTLKEGAIAGAKAALIEFAKSKFGETYVWKWVF